jgi:hypothetical protein
VVGVALLHPYDLVQLRQHGRKTLASPEAAHGTSRQPLHLEDKLMSRVRHCRLPRGYIPAAIGCHYDDANKSKARNKSKHLGRSFRQSSLAALPSSIQKLCQRRREGRCVLVVEQLLPFAAIIREETNVRNALHSKLACKLRITVVVDFAVA